jgi:uncharacterized protein (TIGR02598 family)
MNIRSRFAPHIQSSRSEKAFSLVEVTISLGLVSFALVAVVGLLPAGLLTLRASMNQTVEAQILQSISSRAVISSFYNLTDDELYFDEEGLPVKTLGSSYYEAKLTPDDAAFPGSANAVALADSLMTLRVELVARPDPSARGRSSFHTLHVANSGK